MSEDARFDEPEPKAKGYGPRKIAKVAKGGKPNKNLSPERQVWDIYTTEERLSLKEPESAFLKGRKPFKPVNPVPCSICGNEYLPSQMKYHTMACAQAEALRNEKRGQEPDEDE